MLWFAKYIYFFFCLRQLHFNDGEVFREEALNLPCPPSVCFLKYNSSYIERIQEHSGFAWNLPSQETSPICILHL